MGFTGRNETFRKMDFFFFTIGLYGSEDSCVSQHPVARVSAVVGRISATNYMKTFVVVLDFRRYINTP